MGAQEPKDTAALDEARRFVERTQEQLDRARKVPDEVRQKIQVQLNELRHLIEDCEGGERSMGQMRTRLKEAEAFALQHLAPHVKSAWREYFESIALAVLCALILRGFVVEAFKIPTGSMIPTLLVGDHLFVNKFAYGLRIPFTKHYVVRFGAVDRGQVVVFSFPTTEAREHLALQPASRRECIDRGSLEEEKDFIKRVVALPGDTVEVRENQLMINNAPLPRQFLRRETTGYFLYPHEMHELETNNAHRYTIQYSGSDADFGPVTVEPGHLFVMGDNRDHSSDSRCWGQVPMDNVKGRAVVIWWSIGPEGVRFDRIGKLIHP